MVRGKMTAATEKKEKAERVFFGCVPKTSRDCSSTTPKYFLNIFNLPRMALEASSPLLPY